jgi:hypothetical protein
MPGRDPLAQLLAGGIGGIGPREPAGRETKRERLGAYCVF